jgi:phosphoribosylformylglycinamidine cyclo-ligase
LTGDRRNLLQKNPIDYKNSGVDTQAGDDLVDWLHDSDANNSLLTQQHSSENLNLQKKLQNRVVSGIGGFAALFNAQFDDIKNPLLVSCTDGVGTKVKLASYFNDYSMVGYDLVAMCANDLICTGGRPLFFLDYYASGKLNLDNAKQFLSSVKNACIESEMILIGGETAEMPGVYHANDFDCAGFSVGVVDRDQVWGADRVQAGDHIIALKSSGFHSNGYSLIRKIFDGQYDKYKDWLMQPTRLYVHAATEIKKEFKVNAACHITGGGIENIPRVLPEKFKVVLEAWKMPECFRFVQEKSGMSTLEMLKTLNCGVGFMFIVDPKDSNKICDKLNQIGYENSLIGKVCVKASKDEASVEFK